jgi:pyruvate dehydrogenase E1 component alpha subunit
MLENGWATRAELDAIRAGILREIDDAVQWAEQQPYPDPATLLDDVYESR